MLKKSFSAIAIGIFITLGSSLAFGVHLNDIYFLDVNNGWAVGSGGIILSTSDGGTNWNAIDAPAPYDLNSVHFSSQDVGCIVGDMSVILHTEDGGKTWKVQKSGGHNNLKAVYYIDGAQGLPSNEVKGWAVGDSGIGIRNWEFGIENPQRTKVFLNPNSSCGFQLLASN